MGRPQAPGPHRGRLIDPSQGARGVRSPAVAGLFYPASPRKLEEEVDRLLAPALAMADEGRRPAGPAEGDPASGSADLRGLIVPHAGYAYSGPVAATGFALLVASGVAPTGIVILGPSHFEPLVGLAVPSHLAWRTPLGEVAISPAMRRAALRAGVSVDDRPHAAEHSIEVHLPFLQRMGANAPILPVAVGAGDPDHMADRLDDILGWEGRLDGVVSGEAVRRDDPRPGATPVGEVFLIVSTDLSHFHDVDTACRLDASTAGAIAEGDVEAIGPAEACGYQALRVALRWAARHGLAARLLDLRSSGDTAGDRSRVVGYGAFAMEPATG